MKLPPLEPKHARGQPVSTEKPAAAPEKVAVPADVQATSSTSAASTFEATSGTASPVASVSSGTTSSPLAAPLAVPLAAPLAAAATPADLDTSKKLATTLQGVGEPALQAVGHDAARAVENLQKATVLEVPLRAKLATARTDRMPQTVAGILKDKGGKTTFYPADEGIRPFDVDPALAKELPRNTLLLARATKKKDGDGNGVFYRVNGERPPVLRGTFTGVVDVVDGRAFVRDLVKSPPTYLPLPETDKSGKAWTQGTILAAHVMASTTTGHANDNEALVVDTVLAEGGTAEARSWTVAAGQRLDPTFPPEALAEAKAVAHDPKLDDKSLTDLTAEPFFAIDNHGSRDIDQAMRLKRRADGGFTLQYALADMAGVVKPGMALWDEAMTRGASFYIPGVQVPMQPKDICEGAVSLNAHEDHRALVITVELDKDGKVLSTSSDRAKIHSRAQLTYPGVSEHLEHGAPVDVDEHGKPVPQEVKDQLQIFRDLGTQLRKNARERGVVEPERREMRIGLEGTRFFIHDVESDFASLLNAELSILANCAGASMLANTGIPGIEAPGIFRIHPEPGPEKLEALRRQVAAIIDANKAPKAWKWQKSETLARWVERLRSSASTPREQALSKVLQGQVLGIQVSSEYAREPGLHSGLQVEGYGRFTAPMREVVGLVSHATLVQLESLRRVRDVVKDIPQPELVALWDHMLLGALVEPEQIAPPRLALVKAAAELEKLRGPELEKAARDVLEQMRRAPPLSPDEKRKPDEVVTRALEVGNQARMKQRQCDTASLRLLFDDLFLSDLGGKPEGDPNNPAPIREGIISTVSPGKICVQLADPDVEVRIGRDDLMRKDGETLLLDNDGAELRCACDGLTERHLLVGAAVKVRATYHDGEKLHFTVVD
jgi:hypothetical protein